MPYSSAQVAKLFRVSPTTVQRWVTNKGERGLDATVVRRGFRTFHQISRKNVEEFVARNFPDMVIDWERIDEDQGEDQDKA